MTSAQEELVLWGHSIPNKVAFRFRKTCVDQEDLIAVGHLALCRAARAFPGGSFRSYAYASILNAVRRAVNEEVKHQRGRTEGSPDPGVPSHEGTAEMLKRHLSDDRIDLEICDGLIAGKTYEHIAEDVDRDYKSVWNRIHKMRRRAGDICG